MIESGLIASIGLLLILIRFNIRRICGYATIVDIVATLSFMWMFAGTYAGMMTGLVAGVVVSLTLNTIRKFWGFERATFVRTQGSLLPVVVWIHTPGSYS
jgi:hypothetical protein